MTNSRRGFSLIELLVAMILLFIVGGGIYSLLTTVQRVSKRQTEMANVQANLRSGMQMVQSELQELESVVGGSSDISSMSATAISYTATRGIGETCQTPTQTNVVIRASNYWGLRRPEHTRDAMLLYLDTDTTKITDDSWISSPITAESYSGVCADGNTGYSLTVALTAPQVALLAPIANTPSAGNGPIPIRTTETMEIGQVTNGGQTWLGIRSSSIGTEGTLVPVIGPLTSSGVSFTYYDKDGAVTANTANVKTIVLVLRGLSDRAVNTGLGGAIGNPSDSLQIRVQLRNSR